MKNKILDTILICIILVDSIVTNAAVLIETNNKNGVIEINNKLTEEENSYSLYKLNRYLRKNENKIKNVLIWLDNNEDKLNLPNEFLIGTDNEKMLYSKSFCRYINKPVKRLEDIEQCLDIIKKDFIISVEFSKFKYNALNKSFNKGIVDVEGEGNIDITDKVLKKIEALNENTIFKVIAIGNRENNGEFNENHNFYIKDQRIILKDIDEEILNKDMQVVIRVEYDGMSICSDLNIKLVENEKINMH